MSENLGSLRYTTNDTGRFEAACPETDRNAHINQLFNYITKMICNTVLADVTESCHGGNLSFCIYAKTKAQIKCAVTAQLINVFAFTIIPLLSKSEISSL